MYLRCLSLTGPAPPSSRISENPMIELSGVRSSWLILARNPDFARFAASAASLAARIASSACLRSVTSSVTVRR